MPIANDHKTYRLRAIYDRTALYVADTRSRAGCAPNRADVMSTYVQPAHMTSFSQHAHY